MKEFIMKMSFFISFSIMFVVLFSLLSISCNDDDVPIDTSPLLAEPTTLTVSTGSTEYIAVSGGVIPYTILTSPDPSIATATITTIGVVTILPVTAGATSIVVQDNSDPPRSVNVPINVVIGYGSLAFSWTINGESPTYMCARVNSAQLRVTIDGYTPVLRQCGESTFILDSITAGNHTVTSQLLSPDLSVIATVTQTVFVMPNQSTDVILNFSAPLVVGSVYLTWTINGQPAGTGCANATSVRAAVGSFSPIVEPCSNGQLTVTNIPAGTYNFVADLLDAGNTTLSHYVLNVAFYANQTANVNVDFTIGPIEGSATLNWTINSGQNCSPSGNIGITATGPSSGSFNVPCSDYTYQLTHLGPGTYTFDITLTDPNYPGQQATAQVQNVNVVANADASVAQNIDCLFCGGSSSTGWVQVDVTCGGAACGLTGTLYVMIKDCSGSVALNTETVTGSTLSAGIPVSRLVTNVLTGSRCVEVFLDVDGNGHISSGDAVSSLGQSAPVIVIGGQTANVSVMLDSVNP